jgi:hypothetical protein
MVPQVRARSLGANLGKLMSRPYNVFTVVTKAAAILSLLLGRSGLPLR